METGVSKLNGNQSELETPQWSVLTFDRCAASNLTYAEATQLIEKLKDTGSGLCIVTDVAARKIHSVNGNRQQLETADIPAPASFAETL